MSQTVEITIAAAGTDTGPFNLFSDADTYTTAFATGVLKSELLAGYTSSVVPDAATIVRVKSNNANCTNYVDMTILVPDPCPAPRAYYISNAGNFYWTDCNGNERFDPFEAETEICICNNVDLPVSLNGGTGYLLGGGCTCNP
jgi:hypothetical protein